jgi:L-fuculose-phosphate aldolase
MRSALLNVVKQLSALSLNKGTAGNVSVRTEDGFLITPSGMEVAEMTPNCMVQMHMNGSFENHKKPSSEWRIHRDIHQAREDVNAVVHVHSMFATTLACLNLNIPAFHYMIAVSGGDSIRCAPYALFGTQALSDYALKALVSRKACLLANHGMIAVGRDLEDALRVTLEIENLCEQYWRVLQINSAPPLLSEDEMKEVFEQFKGYGKWSKNM